MEIQTKIEESSRWIYVTFSRVELSNDFSSDINVPIYVHEGSDAAQQGHCCLLSAFRRFYEMATLKLLIWTSIIVVSFEQFSNISGRCFEGCWGGNLRAFGPPGAGQRFQNRRSLVLDRWPLVNSCQGASASNVWRTFSPSQIAIESKGSSSLISPLYYSDCWTGLCERLNWWTANIRRAALGIDCLRLDTRNVLDHMKLA